MSLEFKSILDPGPDLIGRISDLTPENPFYTNEYVRVRESSGSKACALVLQNEHGVINGCLAFVTNGRVNARMEITSLPVIADRTSFWGGVFDACRKIGVSVLSVNTFASLETDIGETSGRTSLKKRSEYRLDLTAPDLWALMNRRHHRLVKRARSAGLTLRRSNDQAARKRHVELANLSLGRRSSKGEKIDGQINIDDVNAFVEFDAGEIIQAVKDGEVFSTILIARSRTGAYAQSSGTSDEGRDIGSSHFLFHEVACLLKSEGMRMFNLGGADERSTGLQEFKLGLGSTRIDLQSAEFYTGTTVKKYVTRAAALLKNLSFPIGV